MRFIDIDDLVRPAGWDFRAANATAALGPATDFNDTVWRDLKDGLADLLHDKCWYCESTIARSDNAVDHFRPKGRCIDAANPHTGYRWLAYDYKNYRYSCTFCNSRRKDLAHGTAGGKADHFPLMNEAQRLYAPGPLYQEVPTLLDPCNLDDWELLGCKQEDGSPCPTTTEADALLRVRKSIEIYHLDHEPTCKMRHSILVTFRSDIDQAKRFFLKSHTSADMKEEFKVTAKKIQRGISRKSQFSGEMIFILKGERHPDHPWIQKLLEI